MNQAPPPDRSLKPALDALARRDEDIARAYAVCGLPPVRSSPTGFEGLLHIVVCQQVSAAAGRAADGSGEHYVGVVGVNGYIPAL